MRSSLRRLNSLALCTSLLPTLFLLLGVPNRSTASESRTAGDAKRSIHAVEVISSDEMRSSRRVRDRETVLVRPDDREILLRVRTQGARRFILSVAGKRSGASRHRSGKVISLPVPDIRQRVVVKLPAKRLCQAEKRIAPRTFLRTSGVRRSSGTSTRLIQGDGFGEAALGCRWPSFLDTRGRSQRMRSTKHMYLESPASMVRRRHYWLTRKRFTKKQCRVTRLIQGRGSAEICEARFIAFQIATMGSKEQVTVSRI
jgi:hypothetical protein